MNTGRFDIPEQDLPGGIVITVRPTPRILIGQVASVRLPRDSVAIEPVGPARVAVLADVLRPGDWVDVDLLTDRRVIIESVAVQLSPRRRTRAPRRRRLRPFDGIQLATDAIGLPIAVTAVVVVGSGLPRAPRAALDVAAAYGWAILAAWAVLSLWGLMDHAVRLTTRRGWPGHPRVFLPWAGK